MLLLTTWTVKKALGRKFVIGQALQFLHNMFLCAQSAFLVMIIAFVYFDTAERAGEDPFTFRGCVNTMLVRVERYENAWFDIGMAAFLLSKLYEQVDTMILIINEKPLIMLHVWHHATTYIAFYMGQFTGAAIWIGFWNSLIHVIMYAYYAKIPGMKIIAKFITSLQLFHLFGGAICN